MAIAQEPTKWNMPLGANADANTIPDATPEYTGAASMDSVFPPITQLPLEAGGIAPTRADFNGLFKLLGASIYYMQRGGIFSYADNVDYPVGAVVKFENGIYIAIQENGPASTVAGPSNANYWRHLTTTVNNQYADPDGNVSITSVANATNATNNASGNQLADSIIKGLSASKATITYTKIDGGTGSVTVNDVAHATSADNGVDSCGSNWIRFKNGVQICWGAGSFGQGTPNPEQMISYPKVFNSLPILGCAPYADGPQSAVVNVRRRTNTQLACVLWSSRTNGNVEFNWIAIGTWK